MIRRIVLDNYMSHAHTEIEPAAGLTVLCGPNNCGKSAVASAIQTLRGDNAGDFMVRHGQRVASVTVATDDGHEITWRRKGGAISYVIDGQEIHRAGKGNLPDRLAEFLRLSKVRPGEGVKEFDVHFGDQKVPIFLIDDQSGSAAFFSTASDAERLLGLQRRHRDKVRDARGRQKDLSAGIARCDAQLAALSALDAVAPRLAELEAGHARLLEEQTRIDALDLLIRRIEQGIRKQAHLRRRRDAMAELAQPPALDDTAALEEAIRRRHACLAAVTQWTARSQRLVPLRDPPELEPVEPLATCLDALSRARRGTTAAGSRATALQQLREPPETADIAPLAQAIEKLNARNGAVRESGRAVADLSRQLAQAESQISQWAAENPTCPLCGGAIDPQRLMQHVESEP